MQRYWRVNVPDALSDGPKNPPLISSALLLPTAKGWMRSSRWVMSSRSRMKIWSGSLARRTHETQAQSLMTKGPCFVIGTCGAAGAVFFDAQGKAELRADRATVVEAVGVGDTFNARVLARLTQDAHLTPHRLARVTA